MNWQSCASSMSSWRGVRDTISRGQRNEGMQVRPRIVRYCPHVGNTAGSLPLSTPPLDFLPYLRCPW